MKRLLKTTVQFLKHENLYQFKASNCLKILNGIQKYKLLRLFEIVIHNLLLKGRNYYISIELIKFTIL